MQLQPEHSFHAKYYILSKKYKHKVYPYYYLALPKDKCKVFPNEFDTRSFFTRLEAGTYILMPKLWNSRFGKVEYAATKRIEHSKTTCKLYARMPDTKPIRFYDRAIWSGSY